MGVFLSEVAKAAVKTLAGINAGSASVPHIGSLAGVNVLRESLLTAHDLQELSNQKEVKQD